MQKHFIKKFKMKMINLLKDYNYLKKKKYLKLMN